MLTCLFDVRWLPFPGPWSWCPRVGLCVFGLSIFIGCHGLVIQLPFGFLFILHGVVPVCVLLDGSGGGVFSVLLCWRRLWITLQPPLFFKRSPGMSDGFLLSGISGLSFDSPFLSPLVFCLVLSLFSLVVFLHMAHSPFFLFFLSAN